VLGVGEHQLKIAFEQMPRSFQYTPVASMLTCVSSTNPRTPVALRSLWQSSSPRHAAAQIHSGDLCGQEFQYGPREQLNGTYLAVYQIMVCSCCYAANEHGWAPRLEEAVTRNLKSTGLIIPARNENGLLPRDGY
jgi:hypothetical protein